MKYISLVLLLIQGWPILAQNSNFQSAPVFPVTELKEDFEILRFQLESIHVGLYEYTPKEDMDHFLDSLYQSIDQPLSALAFYRKIAPLLTKIRNGHTNIFPAEELIDAENREKSFFPFAVTILDKNLYIIRNNSEDTTHLEGARIDSINGIPTSSILAKLLPCETRDGFNLTHPILSLSRGFYRRYAWHYGYPDSLTLQYTHPAGHSTSITVASLPTERVLAIRKARYNPALPRPLGDLQLMEDRRAAIMTIRTFDRNSFRKKVKRYKKWLRESFAVIREKDIQHLILDLRGNGGGDDGTGPLLFSYLYDQPFTYYKDILAWGNKIPQPKYYREKLFFPNLGGPLLTRKTPGGYRLKKNPGYGSFKPKPDLFAGDLYVLTDGYCFSATGELAGCLQHHERGIFIGEEVGGNDHKNTSGAMLNLILPHTKTNIIVPILQYVMDIVPRQKGRGVIPDHPVRPTIKELLSGKDVVLEYALRLIDQK